MSQVEFTSKLSSLISELGDSNQTEATMVADLLEAIVDSAEFGGEEPDPTLVISSMEELRDFAQYVIDRVKALAA